MLYNLIGREIGFKARGAGFDKRFCRLQSALKVASKPRKGKNSLSLAANLRALPKQILPCRGLKPVFPNIYWKNFLRLLDIRQKCVYLCRAFSESRPDPVAQSVEHLTFNQGVMGSSPIGITLIFSGLDDIARLSRFSFAYNLHIFWLISTKILLS